MSPVEIAKAFNARLIGAENSNAEIQELVREAGARLVRYGMVMDGALEKTDGNLSEYLQEYPMEQGQHLEMADPACCAASDALRHDRKVRRQDGWSLSSEL